MVSEEEFGSNILGGMLNRWPKSSFSCLLLTYVLEQLLNKPFKISLSSFYNFHIFSFIKQKKIVKEKKLPFH
jgi:hypothetical protein